MRSGLDALLIGGLIGGAGLRVLRGLLRWDEVALAYSAYPAPVRDALVGMDPGGVLGTWMGLHPPLWAIWHALTELVAPVPMLWLLASITCSLLAVLAVGWRAGGVAAETVVAAVGGARSIVRTMVL